MTLASVIANLARKVLSLMGRTKSSTKTCPDGSVVRSNQKCPISSGTSGQTSGGTVTPSALGGTFTLAENAAAGAVAGALTGVTTVGSTLSLVNSAGSRVALSGSNVVRGSVALDYETAASHSFTVRESNATFVSPGYNDSVLTLTVTNVNDTNPNTFSLTDVVNASTSTVYTSNAISIAGMSSSDTASASIAGAASSEMQKNSGSWGTSPVTVSNGDTLVIRHTSSASAGTTVTTTLTVGNRSDTFTSTTAGSIAYDSTFGTATDGSGLVTFGLHSGSRQVWCNSGAADDTGNGLTAATAKKTLAAAISVWLGAGFSAADQLMLAENGTYNETTGNVNLMGKGGVSKAYPTAILSYDPADAANAAKYGHATGAAMPVLTFPSGSTGAGVTLVSLSGDDGTSNYIAVQGIELKYAANDGDIPIALYVGRHDGIFYQNCRFNGVGLSFPNNSSTHGLSQGVHVSKCSAWGQWATSGNSEWTYFEGINGLYFDDCVIAHGGWKVGASRDDAASAGGAATLGHNYYYHATCINGHIDRIVSVDSATDGHNIRGSATATYLVGLDNPIAGNITGTSNSYSEAASGSSVSVTDSLQMGGADINSANVRGYGFRISNASASGVSISNALFINNPDFSTSNFNNYLMQFDAGNTGVTSATVTLDRVTAWNYAWQHQAISGAETITPVWTNTIADTLAPGGSANSVWGATTFPLAKTRDQIITALLTAASVTPGANYTARKVQLVNLMLYRPDLDWARYLVSIAFPAFNKTQTLASLSPPDLSAVSPAAIY